MIRENKQALVDELSEKFQSHNAFYITDASGMSVAKINEFRRLCFNRGLEFKVYKNTFNRFPFEYVDSEVDNVEDAAPNWVGDETESETEEFAGIPSSPCKQKGPITPVKQGTSSMS